VSCQSCGSTQMVPVLNLGDQPICNSFLKSPDGHEDFYPLRLVRCFYCGLHQLSFVPPASEVFSQSFNYLSSSSGSVVKHYANVAGALITRYGLRSKDLVLDIASNDGVLLAPLKEAGVRTLGVEPVERIAAIATSKGIMTIPARFEEVRLESKPSLITAMDVLAHTDTVHPFLANVASVMAETGAPFVCQSQHFPTSMAKVEYDTIYHEHARYYSVESLQRLLSRHCIQVDDVEFNDFYGGSFIAHCSLGTRRRQFQETVTDDRWFARKALASIAKLASLVRGLDGQIAGIGAPMKSSTLLNAVRLKLTYLAEVNEFKVGTYSPGMHIPVVPEAYFFAHQPDYAVVLSWNMADVIMRKYRERGFKGKFIIPVPEPTVVE
jgi:hypothetical protein